uniref:Uncharacterized protein n=1 Tax=Anguilla anguilla TaxID=7936 RepID=A0A0E9QWS3_ANGAN
MVPELDPIAVKLGSY